MKKEVKTSLILIISVAIFVYFFMQVGEDKLSLQNYDDIDEIANIDSFSNVSEIHWTHMPLTYKFENECNEREIILLRAAFNNIQKETSNSIKFIETNEKSDISLYCKPPQYNRSGEYSLADARYFTESVNSTLIIRGEINIYGQGQICLTGYPALEVHEILHLFDIPHNPKKESIMSPYASESSKKCEITKIDEDYISCLKYIYSNGTFNGNCKFQNIIHEYKNYECPYGTYSAENSDYCCPEPNMTVIGEYCYKM